MFKALLFGAFAACVSAQSKVLFFTHVPNPITDGEPAAITYSTNDTNSPVTIILRQGQQQNLQTIDTLTSNSYGSQFIWTPPKSLPNGVDYALEIKQGSQVNYFGPFVVQGASPSAVSAASKSQASSTISSNSTMTMTGTASNGTATAMMSRNQTMSHHTTMHNSSASTTKTVKTTKTTSTVGSSSGAQFQPTNTGSSGGSGNGNGNGNTTGGASSLMSMGSSFGLAIGVVAAVLFLQ